ncbi:5'-nucleotidase [Rubrivivax sp. A210]|uniref:bifunctional metallophosphatase/5'-nucleotidase n=1 Tax=Rubrivivax sp. A210 TaxID=2772301 RepID=UPI00191824E6|nr:bifunctional metallophosphatase/5'-nucleotidase [Rubrivivax sp. A210]CAD5373283.1 5'-nucleotidase [Rubrivivax sp. A210]
MTLQRPALAAALAALAACASPPQSTPVAPPAAASPAAATSALVPLRVLAINDFHGNLKPPSGGLRMADPARPGATIEVAAGGAEHLATALETLRAGQANHIFVAAGDLIGATPLLSALLHDEPTIESLGLMGLEVSAVGNHEFDKGAAELLRLQRGGCHPVDGCRGPRPWAGAAFQYLAASTVDKASGQTLLPPFVVKRFQGIPVAFIGLALKGTPAIVVPAGVAGLRFDDEADTVNRLVPGLRAQGIEAIVLLIHEGGATTGGINDCPDISGRIVDIVRRLDPAVDLIVSGHTHRAYICRIDGRLVTSGDKYGTLVTQIDLQLDTRSGDVASARAQNVVVRESFAKDARQTALIETYERLVQPLARRVVGRVAAGFTREANAAGESTLGQLIADAQLEATREAGARLALTNPGGMRAPLPRPADGVLRYEDLFSVQPFANNLVTLTLSGAQLLEVLEQQWPAGGRQRVLQVSRGFTYQWDAARPQGQRIVPGSVVLDGKALDPAAPYRVTVNAFLAEGGDGFTKLRRASERRTGVMDVDALESWLRQRPGYGPGALDRIARLN